MTVSLFIRDCLTAFIGEKAALEFETQALEVGNLESETAFLKFIAAHAGSGKIMVRGNEELEEGKKQIKQIIYVNEKAQLIRIKREKLKEYHEILSFDISTLKHAKQHVTTSKNVLLEDFAIPVTIPKKKAEEEKKESSSSDDDSDSSSDDEDKPAPQVRKKVPLGKDGMSQREFIEKADSITNDNPYKTYYTAEEVAKHKKKDDCWTVWNGKVYDITSYIGSHPGGNKIMAGAGKDCTALYNKYHPWVNGDFIMGKLMIGILKE